MLQEQLGARRLRLTSEQRRRLDVRAELLGRVALRSIATLVTPETLLGWYREQVRRRRGAETRVVGWVAELLPSGSGLICARSSFGTPRPAGGESRAA